MKAFFKSFLKCTIYFLILVVVIISGFFIWRYKPVLIRVSHIEKVVQPPRDEIDRDECAKFTMTAIEFEQYFARSHRIFNFETNDYGAGACYYTTKIGNREYSIWLLGLAEISDGNDTDYYADSAQKLPELP